MGILFRAAISEATQRRDPGDHITIRHAFTAGPLRRRKVADQLCAPRPDGLDLKVRELNRSWLLRDHEVIMHGPWPLVVQAARVWDRAVLR